MGASKRKFAVGKIAIFMVSSNSLSQIDKSKSMQAQIHKHRCDTWHRWEHMQVASQFNRPSIYTSFQLMSTNKEKTTISLESPVFPRFWKNLAA